MRRYKILHIITRLDKGGSAINTLSTCLGLAEKGYDVFLVSGLSLESQMTRAEKAEVDQSIKEAGGKGVHFFSLPKLVRRIHPIYDLVAFLQLFFLVLRGKYHIVHTHTSKGGLLGRWAALLAGTPIIIHTPHGDVFSGYFGELTTWVFIFLEKISAMISDSIITLTDRSKENYLEFGIGNREKFRTVHSGIPLKEFAHPKSGTNKKIRARLGIPKDALIVGSAGRLVSIKGYDQFIRVAAIIKKVEPKTIFIIVGEGPLRADLMKLAEELDLSRSVIMPGWKPDLSNWLHIMDVFLLTSRNEGMGRVIVEAMACGKPVVVENVGGVSGVIENGATGFLVPPGDPEVTAKAILQLLQAPKLRRNFGEYGKIKAREFSSEAMVEKIDSLYREWIKIKLVLK